MLSWVFRHRARLGIIYGLSSASAEAAAIEACAEPENLQRRYEPQSEAPPELLAAPREARGAPTDELEPGRWVRRARYVLLRPMRPGSA